MLALLLVRDADDVWLIFLVMTGYGCSSVLLGAGSSALLPDVVPAALLGSANALTRSLREALRIIAPATGAGLFASPGGRGRGRRRRDVRARRRRAAPAAGPRVPARARGAPAPVRSLTAGFRHLVAVRVLRRATIALATVLLVVGFLESAGLALIVDGLHRPAAFIGVTQIAQGIGAVVGGLTRDPTAAADRRVGAHRARRDRHRARVRGLGAPAQPPLRLRRGGPDRCALPWLVIGSETLVQLHTPHALLGRAFGAAEVAASVPQTISIAVGAAALSVVPYGALIAVVAVVCAGAGLWLLRGAGPRSAPVAGRA